MLFLFLGNGGKNGGYLTFSLPKQPWKSKGIEPATSDNQITLPGLQTSCVTTNKLKQTKHQLCRNTPTQPLESEDWRKSAGLKESSVSAGVNKASPGASGLQSSKRVCELPPRPLTVGVGAGQGNLSRMKILQI